MTNYNERLDKILADHREWMRGIRTDHLVGTSSEATKQAITSLIKELVAEAMPEYISPDQPLGLKYQGRNEAIWEFEQNLLKALEEVSEMTPQTPEKFTIPAHGHYPEWSVTIQELLILGRMRRYGRGKWDTKEDLQLSLMGQYRGRYEYEWVTPDGVKHDFYTEVIKPRIDEIWDWYQANKQVIKFNSQFKTGDNRLAKGGEK